MKQKSYKHVQDALTFQDRDLNTCLHFGAKNGNIQICEKVIKEASEIGVIHTIINGRN